MATTRILLDRSTGELVRYPRQDNDPVVDLDRNAYHVLQIIREPQPAPQEGIQLIPLPAVIKISDPDSDDIAGTVTYGWEQQPIPPAPPLPDWAGFAVGLIWEPAVQEWTDQLPAAVGNGLSAGLQRASEGRPDLFLALWLRLIPTIPADVLAAVQALAAASNLPDEFTASLTPAARAEQE